MDCTTKTSRARTFWWISTSHSPVGEAADLGLAQLRTKLGGDFLRQHRIRVACEQDRVEQHVGDSVGGGCAARPGAGHCDQLFQTATLSSSAGQGHLAGEEGFEPSHVGIKIRCLNTTWRLPYTGSGRGRTLQLSQFAQARNGWWVRLRHIRPVQPPGRSPSGHDAPSASTLANTALPDPVIRLLPNRLSNHCATWAMAGHDAWAIG